MYDYMAIREFTRLGNRADRLKKHVDQSKIPVLTFRRLFIVSSCSKAYRTLLAWGMPVAHDVTGMLDTFGTFISDAERFVSKNDLGDDPDAPIIQDEADALKYA